LHASDDTQPSCTLRRLVPQWLPFAFFAEVAAAGLRRFVLRAAATRMGYKLRLTRLETP